MKIKKNKSVFEDERGAIYELLAGIQINHIGYITSKKGSIRGNHFHKKEIQFTLVLKGELLIKTKNLLKKDSKLEEYHLKPMESLEIPPLHFHSVKSLTDSEILFFSTVDRSDGGYDEDTIHVDDINSFQLK